MLPLQLVTLIGTASAAVHTVATADEFGWGSLISNADQIGGWALAIVLVYLMATGRLGSRRAFDQEVAAMRSGYAAKDEAYIEVIAAKDATIRDLEDRNDRKQRALEARDRQVQQLLDEIAPTLQQWAEATATVATAKGGDSDANA